MILQTLVEIRETTVAESDNYDARANHVLSATLALNGLMVLGFHKIGQLILSDMNLHRYLVLIMDRL